MRRSRSFLLAAIVEAFGGGRLYRSWLLLLGLVTLAGAAAYAIQIRDGLYVTNMTDQVSWGMYIANFTFQVGVAAAAVMVVIPAYAYRLNSFKRIVFIGEALALSAVITCLIFVTIDLGHPERAWHLVPWWGSLNFPASILSWDVVVLGGYLVINSTLFWLALRSKFRGVRPDPRVYGTLVFVSMGWAISIHTVTAFLYSWLGARPFWNSAIVTPRFIASAFVSGPAFLILSLRLIRRFAGFEVDEQVFKILRRVMTVTLLVNLFLFAAEVFTELYSGSLHAASLRYLLFGHHSHDALRAYIWTALGLDVFATVVLISALGRRDRWVDMACAAAYLGVWIEKGMALVVPGFIPTPLGEFVEYVPSVVEWVVSAGVWALGLFVFTVLVRLGIHVERGQLRAHAVNERPARASAAASDGSSP